MQSMVRASTGWMMKTNTMTVDGFLILVVKNSFFVYLPIDCFVFVQISSCIYPEAPQRSVWSYFFAPPDFLGSDRSDWSDVWRTGQTGPVRIDMVALILPPAELEHCSTTLFESESSLGTILLIELSDCSSTTGFSLSSVKSEFLLNRPSFWHDRLAWSPRVSFSAQADF